LVPPSYSPAETAQRAIAQYDLNKDGKLDAEELRRCPALLRSLGSMDLNKDGCLDAREIEERLQQFETEKIALMAIMCKVLRDGQPAEGVKVSLVPEKFHGSALNTASGTSDSGGYVTFTTEGQQIPGVAVGFYRVVVSLTDGSGQETLPPGFNTESVLGWEVSPTTLGRGAIKIDLSQ
jgi:hypothetical protein